MVDDEFRKALNVSDFHFPIKLAMYVDFQMKKGLRNKDVSQMKETLDIVMSLLCLVFERDIFML